MSVKDPDAERAEQGFCYEITHAADSGLARAGIIITPHGDIQTPAFIPVGTKANVKTVLPEAMEALGAQALLANAYHLYLQPGPSVIDEAGGLGAFMNWDKPTFTDSGGFQVLSLGVGFKKVLAMDAQTFRSDQVIAKNKERLAHVDDEGVTFKSHLDGSIHRFTSEVSMQIQHQLGADIIMHSGTKFLDGQGRVMAGALCTTQALIDEKLLPVMKNAGMVLSPFNAWVVLKGLETLDIRMRAQSATALALAQWLETQPGVARVHYPGLKSHPQHALAMRQMSNVGGAVLSFEVQSDHPEQGRARAFHVLDHLQVMSLCTNLGDTKTLLAHPASTSHGKLTEAQRQAAGISQGLIRVAVGLDHLSDIQADLERGLSQMP